MRKLALEGAGQYPPGEGKKVLPAPSLGLTGCYTWSARAKLADNFMHVKFQNKKRPVVTLHLTGQEGERDGVTPRGLEGWERRPAPAGGAHSHYRASYSINLFLSNKYCVR